MTGLGAFTKKVAEPTGQGDKALRDELYGIVRDFDAAAARSQQKAIGISEIGHPCPRRIAYQLSGFPEPEGVGSDPWLSIIGTATHDWLARALAHRNAQLGWERYLIEQRVEANGIPGSTDAYDRERFLVIDHKIVGKTTMDKYRTQGPGRKYEVQGHTYGAGWVARGYAVRQVAIAFYPRFTFLNEAFYVWSADYDQSLVDKAFNRLETIQQVVNKLNPARNPEQFTRIPRTPERNCMYCPFWKPGKDTGATCPGNSKI